jgi:hypothetical protein
MQCLSCTCSRELAAKWEGDYLPARRHGRAA